MPTLITCPNCKHEFAPEDAIAKSLEKEYQEKFDNDRQKLMKQFSEQEKTLEEQKREFEKKKEKENQLFAERMEKEKLKMETDIQERLRKTISNDYENQLRLLKESNNDNEEKLKQARHKELEFLKKEKELKIKEEELEISLQKKLSEERLLLVDQIRKQEKEKNEIKETENTLKVKELEKQIEDQKKLVDEMKRKAEQGSMQLQGEVQETALEGILKNAFPFDIVTEVGKGIRGADCIQLVRNNFGQECGKIIYESKRTENFGGDWIEKFKKDMRSNSADIAVLVTKTMPRDLDCFGLKDGVWICTFSEVKALANVLRDGIIRVFNSSKKHENKGDKMHLLYDYLTSNEFSEQWKAIREGFVSMKMSIQVERNAMEKLWKAREKQLEKVLLNSAHIKGSIEGISGTDSINLSLVDEPDLFLDN
ncbi:MAG TPA: DUF2130 domain-containing protein [Hanamia sp.]|jgi:Uncharacterized protein conserved in bacteria|nr:DUF2130 domain-containing protein [Hanamia sp.]